MKDFGERFREIMIEEMTRIHELIASSRVSTPDNITWVLDKSGNKRILIADLRKKSEIYNYAVVELGSEGDFLNNRRYKTEFEYEVTPYEKVIFEVTKDESIEVEKLLKQLRSKNNL